MKPVVSDEELVAIIKGVKTLSEVAGDYKEVAEATIDQQVRDFAFLAQSWTDGVEGNEDESVFTHWLSRAMVILFSSIALGLIVGCLFLAYRDWPTSAQFSNSPTTWAESAARGEFWNGHISAGFAAAGTALLVVTLLMQRDELRLQRKELASTRMETALMRRNAERQLQHSRESAMVTQIVSLISLQFESELSRKRAQGEEKTVAIEHVAALDDTLETLIGSDAVPDEMKTVFRRVLRTGDT